MGHAIDEAFPVALAMGMDPERFWWGDPWEFAAYREARRKQEEARRWERWELGRYVYEALGRTAALMNPYSRSHRADPWVERPFGSDERDVAADAAWDESADHAAFTAYLMRGAPRA